MNKIRHTLFLFLLCVSPFLLQAQELEKFREAPPSPILKLSPFSLIDPLPSIQFALEHQIGSRQSLQHELGYILDIMYDESDDIDRQGIRLRNEYRYYITPDESGYGGFYFGPELLYINYNYQKTNTFGMNCDGFFGCDYYQKIDYKVNKQVFAIHPKLGYQFVVQRFVLDLYGGLGYRYVRVKHDDRPQNARNFDEESFDLFEKSAGFYHLPSLSMGMKLGFLLKKREPEIMPYYKE